MNPEPLVRDHIAEGRLLDLHADRPFDVRLCWQVSRLTAAALRPLTQALRAASATVLIP